MDGKNQTRLPLGNQSSDDTSQSKKERKYLERWEKALWKQAEA